MGLLANVRLVPLSPLPPGGVERNQAANRRAPVPRVGTTLTRKRLAVCGGAPSLARWLRLLRVWEGDIWGINATARFLREQGIDATFYSIDPLPIIAEWAKGCEKGILADTCDPSVFEAIPDVQMAEMGPGGIPASVAGASCAPQIAATCGYTHVTLFGCDCSFDGETHIYRDEAPIDRLRVEVGGQSFLTEAGLLMQADAVASLALAVPDYISVAPGSGLLSALVEHGEGKLTHVSRAMDARMRDHEKAEAAA